MEVLETIGDCDLEGAMFLCPDESLVYRELRGDSAREALRQVNWNGIYIYDGRERRLLGVGYSSSEKGVKKFTYLNPGAYFGMLENAGD